MRAKRSSEIICTCQAYPLHPHRLGGGKCTGAAWCQSFREIDSFLCDNCNHNSGTCDIITGAEKLNNTSCDCIVEELRTRGIEDEYGYLPLNFDSYMETKYQRHYESTT